MSSVVGNVSGRVEMTAARLASRTETIRQAPPCDLAEARVWETLGGGWQCLYGCYGQCGVSIEWHDFACTEACDWSRSFHPDSVEICLNVSGHARLTSGPDSALLGPMTAGIYHTAPGELGAWRLGGEPHQFLTVEFSRAYLERHWRGHELELHPALRVALQRPSGARRIVRVFRLAGAERKSIELLRHPPVAGAAQNLWYQGKALEIMAEFLFGSDGGEIGVRPRQAEVARRRTERAIQILTRRLAEPPSLEELGREVGCSPYHLSRTFSHEMGMTIPQYLRQIRMERAAELLKSGKFNVTEAALEVGYSSLSHFSQAFCETMGCCPCLYPLGATRPPLRGRLPV